MAFCALWPLVAIACPQRIHLRKLVIAKARHAILQAIELVGDRLGIKPALEVCLRDVPSQSRSASATRSPRSAESVITPASEQRQQDD